MGVGDGMTTKNSKEDNGIIWVLILVVVMQFYAFFKSPRTVQ